MSHLPGEYQAGTLAGSNLISVAVDTATLQYLAAHTEVYDDFVPRTRGGQ